MTTKTYNILWTALLVLCCYIGSSQVSELDNNSFFSADYLGWDNNTTFDLNVKHEGDRNINWHTSNLPRMRLTNTGLLGLGITTPQNCFHIHNAVGAGINLTTNGTGSGAGDGMTLSLDNVSLHFRLREDMPMRWSTQNLERMTLTNIGWLGLNITNPVALLNFEDGAVVFNGTTGANPDYNAAGTRMMWIPEQGAFHMGMA